MLVLVVAVPTAAASHPPQPYWHYDKYDNWIYSVGPQSFHHKTNFRQKKVRNRRPVIAEVDRDFLGFVAIISGLHLLTNNGE